MSKEDNLYPIHLSSDWCVWVNKRGYAVSKCLEGALGHVLMLQSRTGASAWKIPKLGADTARENAYVCRLANEEEQVAQEIFATPTTKLPRPGGPRNPMKLVQCFSDPGSTDRREVLLARYDKGEPPRFCCLTEDGKFYPPGIPEDELPDEAARKLLFREAARGAEHRRALAMRDTPCAADDSVKAEPPVPYLCEVPEREAPEEGDTTKRNTGGYPLDDTAEAGYFCPWYAFLPSIIFPWMKMTLQEVIKTNKRGTWTFFQHLALTRAILIDLRDLHDRRVLHGDVRAANIMCPKDPTDPETFCVIDFGSFRFNDIEFGGGGGVGYTEYRQRAGAERSSPFYAPERRKAVEEESADTAVILRRNDKFVVLLGWRSELLGVNDGDRDSRIAQLEQFAERQGRRPIANSDGESLGDGDRLRLRDTVFTVSYETKIPELTEKGIGHRLVICDERLCRAIHGDLVVPDSDAARDFDKPRVMSIPAVIELPKWAVPVDIYGVGAVTLYSVYWSPVGDEANLKPKLGPATESEFCDMITELENEVFFRKIWTTLDPLRLELEQCALLSARDADAAKNLLHATNAKPSLMEKMRTEVGNLTRNVRGLERVCHALRRNPSHFVFFLHFVLCCLHRGSTLAKRDERKAKLLPMVPAGDGAGKNGKGVEPRTSSASDAGAAMPFCEGRDGEPGPGGPTTVAMERLNEMLQRAGADILQTQEAHLSTQEIPPYAHPGAKVIELQNEIREASERRERQTEKLESAVADRDKLAGECNALAGFVEKLSEAAKSHPKALVRSELSKLVGQAPRPTARPDQGRSESEKEMVQ